MARGATTIGLQQVQHSQLSEQICEDLGLVQHSIVTLQNQLDSLAAVVLQNRGGLDLIAAEKGRNLHVFWGRMLLLCKPVSDSEKKCMPTTREDQGKERNKEAFWNTGWKSWAPGEPPCQAPSLCSLGLYS
jgi:hypothetical protein